MIKPFIVHEGQVYINQALVADQSACQVAAMSSETRARSSADARLAGELDRTEPEGLYLGLCGLEPFDPEAIGREFRTDVMSILAEELRPGGLLWKHISN